MNYTITIGNQPAFIQHFPELDIIDAAIIDWCSRFSRKADTIILDGKKYFWYCYSKAIQDLPLCQITSDRVMARRFFKLVQSQVLIRHPQNKTLKRSFFGWTEKSEILFSSAESTIHPSVYSEKGATIHSPVYSDYTLNSVVYPNTIDPNTNKKINKKRNVRSKQECLTDEKFIRDISNKFQEYSAGSIQVEIDSMLDYLKSKGIRPKDYQARFRNWMRNKRKWEKGKKVIQDQAKKVILAENGQPVQRINKRGELETIYLTS